MKNILNKFQKLGFWYRGSQRLVNTAGFIFLAVILVAGTAYSLYQNDRQRKAAQIKPTDEIAPLPGWWYKDYFKSSVCESDECKADADLDRDGLTNAQEFYYRTSPLDADTNKNGASDGEDVANDIDPSREGNLKFDQVASDDNIFGESMVFDQDIKNEITKSLDPNQIKLPLAPESEISLTSDRSNEAAIDYVVAVNQVISKYFTRDQATYVEQAVKSRDPERIEDIKLRAAKVETELKALKVPADFATIHNYTITLFNLMGKVVTVPEDALLTNDFSTTSNAWFDNAQAFMYLIQKTSQEYTRLKQVYNIGND